MAKKMYALALLTLTLIVLPACTEHEEQKPIKLGGAFALTGWAAAWGEDDLRGATLAIEEINANGGINGRRIEIIIEDTQSDNDATLTAVHALVNLHQVDAIIGPTWLETFGSAATISDEGTIMITPSGVIEAIQLERYHQYIYSTWYPLEKELSVLLKHLSEQGDKQIVLLMGLTPYWQAISKIVTRDAEQYDITVLATYATSNSEDYRTLLLQINELSPDAILFGIDDEQSMFAFVKQRQELGIDSLFVGQEYLLPFATDEKVARYFEGIQIVAPADIPESFKKKFKKRFKEKPKVAASTAYDAARILIEAFEATDGSVADVSAYLNTHSFSTVTYGQTGFRRNGGIYGGEFVMYEARDGEAILIS